ncbi:MAG TPA: hypothetical protein VE030_08550 [Burkholderiales bacterium]|nr:hypothetical protein [Burkholderiales bacterium]
METTVAVNQIATQDNRFDVLGADSGFEMDPDDSVCDAYEFLGAVGFARGEAYSLAVDMIELS